MNKLKTILKWTILLSTTLILLVIMWVMFEIQSDKNFTFTFVKSLTANADLQSPEDATIIEEFSKTPVDLNTTRVIHK